MFLYPYVIYITEPNRSTWDPQQRQNCLQYDAMKKRKTDLVVWHRPKAGEQKNMETVLLCSHSVVSHPNLASILLISTVSETASPSVAITRHDFPRKFLLPTKLQWLQLYLTALGTVGIPYSIRLSAVPGSTLQLFRHGYDPTIEQMTIPSGGGTIIVHHPWWSRSSTINLTISHH